MPRVGGEANKFGNRYESLWVVDAVLDLIDGEYGDLTVEPIRDEAAGVEFFRTNRGDTREYHSIKRQQGDGNWTLSRLTSQGPTQRSILGDLFQKIREGHDGVFSSGTSATDLEGLVDHAMASSSFPLFLQRIDSNARLSAEFRKRIAPMCEGEESAYAALRRLRVRTMNEPELVRHVELRIRKTFSVTNGTQLVPRTARLLITDLVQGRLGESLTADSLTPELEAHGIRRSRLRGEGAVGEQLRRLNRAYLKEVNALLINRAEIARQESVVAREALVADGKSVMIEGAAGGGKTGVVAQVLEGLEDSGVPCVVVRLDRLTEADRSAQRLGRNRGLPESPTTTLGEFAGEQPSVSASPRTATSCGVSSSSAASTGWTSRRWPWRSRT